MTEEMDKLCRDAANVIDLDILYTADVLMKIVNALADGNEKARDRALIELGVLKESMVRECPKARRIMNQLREGRLVEPKLTEEDKKVIFDHYRNASKFSTDDFEEFDEEIRPEAVRVAIQGYVAGKHPKFFKPFGPPTCVYTNDPDFYKLDIDDPYANVRPKKAEPEVKAVRRGRRPKATVAEPKKRGRKPKVKK